LKKKDYNYAITNSPPPPPLSVIQQPQQNGVVERKNRKVQEMSRTMIMDSKLIDIFWIEEVHTAVHTQNRVMLRNNTNKTPYDLWKGRPENVKHFKFFGRKCCIKREDGRMGKSTNQRQYRSMIGSLLYVTVCRPYVMQAVGQVARFQASPNESCVLAVKRIFKYLKGT
jgi:hypothetical protein